MLISPPSDASQDPPRNVEPALRAEADAAGVPLARARLLLELALHAQARGDDDAAARDLVAAGEQNPYFTQPVLQLLSLSERTGSTGTAELYERLLTLAEQPALRRHAVLARASALGNEPQRLQAAQLELEGWLQAHPDDVAAWFALERVATQSGDLALRCKALGERARRAQHPLYGAALLLELAGLQTTAGEQVEAKQSLEAALQLRSSLTLQALTSLERVARGCDPAAFLGALDARARLLASTLDQPGNASALGVPSDQSIAPAAAAAAMLAANEHFRDGDAERAGLLLDTALAQLPNQPLVQSLRLRVAEAAGDSETTAQLAQALLDGGARGAAAAALWLSLGRARSELGDVVAARQALEQAVRADASCWLARAGLLTTDDESAYAEELAQLADLSTSNETKLHFDLATAEARARAAGAVQPALTTLQRASAHGEAQTVARVKRFLATLLNDANGFAEASVELLSLLDQTESGATLTSAEVRDLALQVLREQARSDDASALEHTLSLLSGHDLPLAEAIRAYLPRFDTASSIAALDRLAELQDDAATRRALQLSVARRAVLHSEGALAQASLRRVVQQTPEDAVASTALGELLRDSGELIASASVLSACARQLGPPQQRAALESLSAITNWRAGARHAAVDALLRASVAGGDLPELVTRWCEWAAAVSNGHSSSEKCAALARLAQASPDEPYCQLQLFARALTESDAGSLASQALRSIGTRDQDSTGFDQAVLLARALNDASDADLERVQSLCEGATALTAATRHLTASGTERLASARNWSQADPSAASALQWLTLAHADGDPEQEAEALLELARRLPEPEAIALTEAANLLTWCRDPSSPDLALNPNSALGAELSTADEPPSTRATALETSLASLPSESARLRVLIGYSHLEAGELAEAELSFRAVVHDDAEDISAWEGLREVASRTDDPELMVEALAAIGDTTGDEEAARDLWQRASEILLERLGDEERGRLALARAVEIDPAHRENYEKLVGLVQRRRDSRWLVRLIDLRLRAVSAPAERLTLFWDKARALRRMGELAGALVTLGRVTQIEPDHVGALALSGEIHLTRGDYLPACDKLSALSQHNLAPLRQRLISGQAAADIAHSKLGDPARAIDILRGLCESDIADLAVRERLVKLAADNDRWELAAAQLNELMLERRDAEGRIAAARLLIAIQRDKLNRPAETSAAVEALLRDAPEDAEALDLVLSGVLPEAVQTRLLDQGRIALLAYLQEHPDEGEAVLRLVAIAHALSDLPVHQIALGVARSQGHPDPAIEQSLAALAARSAVTPGGRLDEAQLAALCDPGDHGPLSEICSAIAPTLAELLGPNLHSLGVGKQDLLPAARAMSGATQVLAWADVFGLGDLELYLAANPGVSAPDAEFTAVPTARGAAFVLTAETPAGLTPVQLASVARQCLAARRGTLVLCQQSAQQVAALLGALCETSGHPLPNSPTGAPTAFVNKLHRALPRKTRKRVTALAQTSAERRLDPLSWAQAAQRSLDRAAALALGDISQVQQEMGRDWGRGTADRDANERTQALRTFAFSPVLRELRQRLGVEPK